MNPSLNRTLALIGAGCLALTVAGATVYAAPIPQNGAEDLGAEREIQRQRARAQFDASLRRAQDLLSQNDFSGATQEVGIARAQVQSFRSYFSEAEFEQFGDEAQRMLDTIEDARQAFDLAEGVAQGQNVAEAQLDEAQRQAMERRNIINENLRRVRQLQMEQKYEEALQVIDQILFLDEHNAAALALHDAIRPLLMYHDYLRLQRIKDWSINSLTIENQQSVIPPAKNLRGPGPRSTSGIMSYPEDWPQLSLLRTGAVGWGETAADVRVGRVLADVRVPAEFKRNTFSQVVAYFRNVTEEDFYVDWKALELIGVTENDEVTLTLSDVSVENALERVLEQLGDGMDRPKFDVHDGMVRISTEDQLRQNTMTRIYDIRDLLFEVPYFDNAPKMDLSSALSQANAMAVGSGQPFGGDGEGQIFEAPDVERTSKTSRQELIEQVVQIIQDNVDPDGWRELGGDTGSIQELNGNLIIRQTPKQHRQIEGLLSQLREIRAIQINVEGRILDVETNWFEQIGVDLDLYFNTNSGLFDQLRAGDPLAQLSDFFDPANRGRLKDPVIFTDINQVDDDGNITGPPGANTVSYGTAFGVPNAPGTPGDTIGYVVGPVGPPIRNTDGFSPIPVIQNSLELVNDLAAFDLASFAGLAAAGGPALATGLQFLDDVQVDLLIEATQADNRSVVLTAPRLTFFNGQRSFVIVQTQTTFISGLTAVTGDNSGAFQPFLSPLNEGVTLDVEGVVSADRRYVTLTVSIGLSEVLAIEQKGPFGGAAGGGSFGGNSNNFEGFVESPTIQVSQVNTTVSVPDRGTVLLGGQRVVNEVEVEVGVPVLSKIPIVNRFFTNRVTSKDESTLLILIRPEIIIQQEHEEILFPGLTDQLGTLPAYFQ